MGLYRVPPPSVALGPLFSAAMGLIDMIDMIAIGPSLKNWHTLLLVLVG